LAKAPADLATALDQLSAAAKRPAGPPPTLAVLPFQIAGGASPEAAAVASETAVLHLARDSGWKLVERARFQSILQEQALWGSGATASELEIGRALEARYLLAGTVATDGLRRLVALRLLDAVDGRIVATGAARVDGPKMDEALKEALGEKFGVSGAVFRSISVPGWGQFWTERPVRGSLWLGATLGLAGALTWSVLDWADKDNASEDFKNRDVSTFRAGESPDDWIARANAAIDDRNAAATRNLVLGSALAGTWLLNVADAAWCGSRSARSARARYFAFAPVVGPDAAGARLTIALGASR
jgi:TolB-like protein